MSASQSTAIRKRSTSLKKRHDSDTAVVQQDKHVRNDGEVDSLKDELADKVEAWREKVEQQEQKFYGKRRFLFPLGIILGVLLGFILIQPNDFTDFQTHLALLLDEFDFSSSLPQLPQFDNPFDLSLVENEWRRLKSNIPEPWKLNNNGLEFTVGEAIAERGLSAKHPVILVPGIISTGLESWSTSPDFRPFFRQKMWGGFSMLSQVTFNRDRWISAIMLDPLTGLDPPHAKVRAAEGIDAASMFMRGYWLWQKVVENLAVVGYDSTNNLGMASYDWRLSFGNLEVRDGYFSRLKGVIEGFNFKWVESPEHGNGGSDWVEKHVEALITIAGTHLAKAMSAFLSGEMKDTVQMNPAGAYVLERFFSRKERRKLFHSWAGSASMWIKGGDAVWGNETFAPDDPSNADHTHGSLIAFRDTSSNPETNANAEEHHHPVTQTHDLPLNMTASTASSWILERTPTHFQRMVASNYSFGIERDEEKLRWNGVWDPRTWSNPLEVQLPNAPSTKLVCAYGVGKDTERSYWYTRGAYEFDDVQPDAHDPSCDPSSSNTTDCTPLNMPLSRRIFIDSEYTDPGVRPKITNGVKMGEGDGTVSLLSLGAMCVEGWKRRRWNPAGMKVVTVELPHEPVATIPRGGGTTGDHVDVLGNTALNELILKVATGAGDELEDSFVSHIREYAKRVQWD
ncbi:LACT-domain-containing protein [Irpex lacteus]|nr:LACT-domain-containing protein [Irpex lacteus]